MSVPLPSSPDFELEREPHSLRASPQWPTVSLAELLTHRKEFIQIDDLTHYKRCRVQLHAQGIVLRDHVLGAEIKTKKQQVCKAGDFLVAEIDAKVGGYGIVPAELDGAIVSSHYFLFGVNESRLERAYLGYYIRTSAFMEQVAAQGSTNYAAIRPGHVLQYTLPLPPITEQRRLVQRLNAFADKFEKAQSLREAASTETQALLRARTGHVFDQLAHDFPVRAFNEFQPHVTSGPRSWGPRLVEQGDRFYRAQDILPNGKLGNEGKVFIEPPPTNQGASARLQPGDLMIVITGATVGRVTVYPRSSEPGYVNQHVAICRLDASQLDPRYSLWGLLSPYGQAQLLGQRYGQGKPGLNLTNIRSLRLPVPSLDKQRQVIAYLDNLAEKTDLARRDQAATQHELNALLPAILDRAFRGDLL